ncbi:MAG: DMT family transporter [Proteobacteria bacterium]|uniref:DMT family transporter n=1 Tax=Candidatus Desulfatibia profunda TaxID=2841695 RepID=A0A8J6NMY2_9BACT|nr:DMT family transporter [Candidatus Desulfatibia profunda]MBU0697915.1 DMT family transporter [Pseudomonadota bacterium]
MKAEASSNQDLSFPAAVFTLCLCTLFGANAVAIKISLSGLGVFTTAGLRFGIASVTIFLWARITGRTFHIQKEQIYQLLILSIVFTVQLSLFYLGLSKSNASRGTLLLNLQPFFTLFLAHFFIPGDRITVRKTLGIFMGFAGVAFVFLERKGVTADLYVGDLMILTATLLWSCSAVYTKKIIHSYLPFHIVLYPMILAVPFFFLEGFLWDGAMIFHMDARILGALLYQSLITASFGFVAWISLLRKYGAVSLHSFIFIMPIAGVLLGGLILEEPITPKILIALLLIVSGILVIHFKQKKIIPLFPLGRNV